MVRRASARPALRISLQRDGRVIHEIRSTDISGEIQIGRSSACAWQTPADEPLIGKQHAVLLIRRGKLLLRDNDSTNGTWFQDQRIKERALQPGDRIAIGHCAIVVERESAAPAAKKAPQVTLLSGKLRQQRFPIPIGSFTIGSGPEANLVLPDPVSRQHAVIVRKEDESCWLRDLNSTNGTRVNDEPQRLRPDQERPLKDGDRILVADRELVFRDGTGRRDQSQALRRLASLVVVTLLAAGAYYAWQSIRPSADAVVRQARTDLEHARTLREIAKADSTLDRAISRSGYYGEVQAKAERLRTQISNCRHAVKQWQDIKVSLENQAWTNAASRLAELMPYVDGGEAWVWRGGPEARNDARTLKSWLDAYLRAGDPKAVASATLSETREELRVAIEALNSKNEIALLRKAMQGRLEELDRLLDARDQLDKLLQQLCRSDGVIQPWEILRDMQNIIVANANVRREDTDKVLRVLERLAKASDQLTNAAMAALEMRFREALALELNLPRFDDCAINTNLSWFHHHLEERWQNQQRQISAVGSLARGLTNRFQTADGLPAEIAYWTNWSVLQKVFDCDCLNLPYASSYRTSFQGEYDRAVKIEWFYDMLNHPEWPPDYPGLDPQPGWTSHLEAARQTISAAKDFQEFFKDAKHQWWLQTRTSEANRVAQWEQAAERTLAWRKRLAEDFRARAKNFGATPGQSSGRQALIAFGLARQFMDRPDPDLLKELGTQFTNVCQNVKALEEKYKNKLQVEQRLALRDEILKTGLPGDPTVREKWIEAASAARGAGR